MNRLILSSLLLLFISIMASAQNADADSVKNWKLGGDFSFTFSQVSLNNWSAGGQNSVSGNTLLNTFANYAKGKNAWDNTLQIGYGLTQQGSDNLIKSDDRIQLSSKYGYKASDRWFYSGLLDFKTQMTTGYQDPPTNSKVISELFSPAYLLFSLGMDYKPNETFSLYLSPLTGKSTFVLDDTLSFYGAYGVEPGENSRTEFGAMLKSVYKKENIVKNVDLYSQLNLFSNLVEDPQYVDVDWELRLNMKVNKFLTAVASLNLLYDNDIKYIDENGDERGARVQTKQMLGFGLNYKF